MNYLKIYYNKLKTNYLNFFIIFFIWSSLFVSLNTSFVPILFLFDKFSLSGIISSRSIFLIISVILIIFFILRNGIKLQGNFFYILLLSILAIQSIYFFSNDFNLIAEISLSNIYENNLFSKIEYGLQLQAVQLFFSIFVSLFLFLIFNSKKNEDAFIFTFIFFLITFCIFYVSLFVASIPSHMNSPDILFYFNSFFSHNSQLIAGEPAIRITGIGRSLVLISLILFCLYLLIPKKNGYFKFFLLILIILINSSIILTGSRFASYSFIFTYVVLFFLLNFEFKRKIKYFITFVILPILLFYLAGNIIQHIQLNKKINQLNKIINENKSNETLKEKKLLRKIQKYKNEIKGIEILKDTRYFEKVNNTTGRVEIWENAFEIINQKSNYVFGNGINADRRLLVKYGNIFGTNASNGFINILLTGGIFSLLLFILANLIILKSIYNFVFIEKSFSNFKKYYLINISILNIFVFYQRTVFENSITSFGLDYLIYIVCCYFLLNKIKTI